MFTLRIATEFADRESLTMEEIAAVLRDVADRMEDRKGANYCPNVDGTIHAPEPHAPHPIGKFSYRS